MTPKELLRLRIEDLTEAQALEVLAALEHIEGLTEAQALEVLAALERCVVDAAQRLDDQVIEYRELAKRASTFMLADAVKPGAAKAYHELLTSGETGDPMQDFLEGADLETARQWPGKSAPVPGPLRDSLREAYSHLHPRHQWMKGVIATAIAISYPDAVGNYGEDADVSWTRPRRQRWWQRHK